MHLLARLLKGVIGWLLALFALTRVGGVRITAGKPPEHSEARTKILRIK
jgi:hypothetical protein